MGMGQIVDYSQFILQIEKAIANGVATLDSNAKVPKNQIDLIASDVGAISVGGESGTALKLTTPRTIETTGDATYSVSFDGSANVSAAITLANSGVTAGTYNALATQVRPFTVDSKGRITGVGTAVDITPPWSSITSKPSPITYLENNSTPPTWNYWLFGNFYGQYWELIPVSQNAGNNTVLLRTNTGGLIGKTFSATATTPSTSPTTGASVIGGGQGIGGDQHIGGFSSLGGVDGGHPAIKIKTYEGTTSDTDGGVVTVAHGLNSAKIINISAIVRQTATSMIKDEHTRSANFRFSVTADVTNISVSNISGQSANILSKPFVVTVFYVA